MNAFRDVDWGPDEAKGDVRLADYFVTVPDFPDIIGGQKRYVIGRKGTGKTAILEKVRLSATGDPLTFARSISLRNFPLRLIRDLRDKTLRDKSQFVPVWTFLIATEFSRLVLEDQGSGPTEAVTKIRRFFEVNFPSADHDISDTLRHLSEQGSKLTLEAQFVGASHSVAASTETVHQVHFQKVTDSLLDLLSQVRTDSVYYLLMDELDEGYRAGDPNLRLLLLALLRATEDVSLRLRAAAPQYKPILVLRSDIFDRLEDNDLNKLDDYVVRLAWRGEPARAYSLRDVVDARIRASIELPPEADAWTTIALDKDPGLPRKVGSLWKYMVNRTFERPRDIVKFLKECRQFAAGTQLTFADVRRAERLYSDWLYRELRDEIHSQLPVWKEALACITRIGRGKFRVDQLNRELLQDSSVGRWLNENGESPDTIISALFDFGVVGNLSRDRVWLFKYKDSDLVWNPEMALILHYGLHHKLRVLRGGYE